MKTQRVRRMGLILMCGIAAGLNCVAADFSQWSWRSQISFPGYSQSGTLTNFPALVALSTGITGFAYNQFEGTAGSDLRFTASDETTELNYEIDTWNTGGTSYVWVQVPALSGTNTSIWAFWGKTGVSVPAFSTNGATWSNGYVAVFHMAETNSAGLLPDSTANACFGTNSGTTLTSGKIGNARNFNGSSQYINGGDRTAYNDMVNNATAEMWFNASSAGSYPQLFWRVNYAYYFGLSMQADWKYPSLQVGTAGVSYNTAIVLSQWYYLTGTFDNSTGAKLLYLDGQQVASRVYSDGVIPDSGALYLGTSDGSQKFWPGMLDEVRFSSVTRSSNWVWACNMTMGNNSSFSSYGQATRQMPLGPVLRIK